MRGLTSQEVNEAIRLGKSNEQVTSSAKTEKDIIKENVFTYFNLIFLILSILLIIAGAYKSLTFLPVIIINMVIGIVQELRAKMVLDKLSVLSEPKAVVVRDGKEQTVAVAGLVERDLIMLTAGNQIPADAIVVAGNVNVNESLLTGESDEIEKREGSELMSGSFVVSGKCYAQLTRVGKESYISKLMLQAKSMETKEESEMVRSINIFVKLAGILIIPIGIILFYQSYVQKSLGFAASVTSMVAAVIGMIPEGLYLLVSLTLALGAARLAMKKVMLHDMKSIETLARVDVLCVDKTGTITGNEMVVNGLVYPGQLSQEEEMARKAMVVSYIGSMPDENITMKALRDYFTGPGSMAEPLEVMAFSSKYKYSAIRYPNGTFVMGAPEIVMAANYESYRPLVEQHAARGYRVLVFGQLQPLPGQPLPPPLPDQGIGQAAVIPALFILLENPIRENARDTFTYFKGQGVEVKVISGDNPVTVSRVAANAGIDWADEYVDAGSLDSPEKISQAVRNYTVFGRVKPDQKQEIVRALQAQGRTVAMTGDGVNDILAMKDADCSVAMASGSDAAVQASQVVLLDSDFSHMPEIVDEGRKVINNIERSATLFLVKNIFSMLLAAFSIISVIAYPLQPTQISLISAFNIGLPAFLLALEPNYERIKGRFMSKVLLKATPAALTDFLVIAALVIFGDTFGVSVKDISVASTVLLAIVGFIILYNISKPMNLYRIVVIAGCMVGMFACAYFFHRLFGISYISDKCYMLFLLFAIATEPFMRYLTMFSNWLLAKLDSHDARKEASIQGAGAEGAESLSQQPGGQSQAPGPINSQPESQPANYGQTPAGQSVNYGQTPAGQATNYSQAPANQPGNYGHAPANQPVDYGQVPANQPVDYGQAPSNVPANFGQASVNVPVADYSQLPADKPGAEESQTRSSGQMQVWNPANQAQDQDSGRGLGAFIRRRRRKS